MSTPLNNSERIVPVGMRIKKDSRDAIIAAARAINSVCDGARTEDGHGFNKGDSDWFKMRLDVWTDIYSDEVVCQMYNKLQLYKNQLARNDYDYDTLTPIFENIPKEMITGDPSWSQVKVGFGKYSTLTWAQVVATNKSYLDWILSPSYNNDNVKEIARLIIAGKPIPIPKPVRMGDYIVIEKEGEDLVIESSYSYKDRLKAVLPLKSWNGDKKRWMSKIMWIDPLIDEFPDAELSPEIQKIVETRKQMKAIAHAMHSNVQYDLGEFGNGKKLMPFQMAGLHFVELGNGRVIVADEMGTGKTIMALAYLQLHKEDRLAVVVCPASVKGNWRKEANQWLSPNEHVQIAEGSKPVPITGKILIINYDIMAKWMSAILAVNPKIIIFDESHRLKNRKTNRTKAAKEFANKVPKVLMLTGTPVLNRPVELYAPLNILYPESYPDDGLTFIKWAQRYCDAEKTEHGWNTSGASNLDILKKELEAIMIRRTKEMVLPELPKKMRNTVVLPLNNRSKYEEQYKAFGKWLMENRDKSEAYIEAVVRIEYMKQMCVEGKLDAAIEWINDSFIETETKVVLFATHKFVIDRLMKEYEGIAVKIDGSVSPKDREAIKEQFQNDPNIRVFVGNMQAAGEGITLTAASNVVFLELAWTPAIHNQAEDRCHRITQNDSVFCWYLLADKSIENGLLQPMLEHKRQVTESITGDEKKLDFKLFENLYDEAMKAQIEEGTKSAEKMLKW